MPVVGGYIAWRIRKGVVPYLRVYGQWVEERIIPATSQFSQMADAAEQQAYEDIMSQPVGEDYIGDGSEEAEYAFNVGLSFYQDITNMYQSTLNLFAAGLFHVTEQQLADLTRDGAFGIQVSETKLQVVVEFYLKYFQIDLKQFPMWSAIEELRLVANTTKHAEGSAARQLRGIHPELFRNPLLSSDMPTLHTPVHLPLGGDGLYVTGDDFRAYQNAVLAIFEGLAAHFERNGDEYYPLRC